MGDYTKSVAELIETYGSGDTLLEKISSAAPYIFDFSYPIFDESYRRPLEIKILKRYFTREICESDEELWKLRLDSVLNEIMPYYNQFYESTVLEINPLYTHFLKTDRTVDNTGSKNGDTKSTKTSTQLESGDVKVSTEDEESNINGTTTQTSDTSKDVSNQISENKEKVESSAITKGKNKETGSNDVKKSGSNSLTVKESDTPMGSIENLDDGYMTKARKENSDFSEDSNGKTSRELTTEDTYSGEDNKISNSNSSINGSTKRDVIDIKTGQTNINRSGSSTTEDSREKTITDEGNVKTGETLTSTEKYLENVAGNTGISQSRLLNEYRETFLNIDKEIVDALSTLFILLW